MSSKAESNVNGVAMKLIQHTRYPLDGEISLSVSGNGVKRIAIRIPYWCTGYNLKINGIIAKEDDVLANKGYAYINLPLQDKNTIDISFDMKVQLIEASPSVQENSGRVALQRGPVVYCLEAVDNGNQLRDIRIDSGASFEIIQESDFGIPIIQTTGYRRKTEAFKSSLYKPSPGELESVGLKFIPYFGFANRGESEMVIWVLKR